MFCIKQWAKAETNTKLHAQTNIRCVRLAKVVLEENSLEEVKTTIGFL